MKRIFAFLCAAVMACSCSTTPNVKVTFENSTNVDRKEEMAEVDLESVKSQLALEGDASLVVYNPRGKEIPSQITYDGKLIFQVDVAPQSSSTYKIEAGVPAEYETMVYGRKFPERLDDFAWENDRCAYRVYGPASQALDQKLYGYDVWTKSVPHMILEERYRKDLDPAWRAEIAKVAVTDQDKADEMLRSVSFHVDHGDGMDAYNVGPTLGAGTAALMHQGAIVYPYCYEEYEVLDNGPLRLTVKLTFGANAVGKNEDVVEIRTITADAGSHFNKTTIIYENLKKSSSIVAGIVMASAKSKQTKVSKEEGFAAYADIDRDPKDGAIFVGTIFTTPVKSAGIMPFTNDDPVLKQAGMTGHVALIGDYAPQTEFVYYWGAAWAKANITTFDEWVDLLSATSAMVKYPLVVTMK
ncbi:MAG: DUF4861 family protein [Rikenellaceae bacterium]